MRIRNSLKYKVSDKRGSEEDEDVHVDLYGAEPTTGEVAWTVLFYFARAKLAARDVAIHDIMVAMVKKPMPPEVAGSAARRW